MVVFVEYMLGGGIPTSGNSKDELFFVTISTQGNATDFGDLTASKKVAAWWDQKLVHYLHGGENTSDHNTLILLTFSSTGDATDFGDLTHKSKRWWRYVNQTRGIFNCRWKYPKT